MHDFFRRRRVRAIAVAASALAMAGGGLAAAQTAGAASQPSPPFNQCPSIGSSPSCEILLVVNSDNSITVLNDSSAGTFDGSDDTLVGIVNNSSAAVKAITVSGPGSGLAGLDGDGICSGDYGTWSGSSGCPYGPTGYEGPGTSLVTKASLPDIAEVDFTGGLAVGKSAYFSLEGALATATLTAREGKLPTRYVAIGDSFSSGEGNPQFIKGTDTTSHFGLGTTDQCHRSAAAYGPQIQADESIQASDFVFKACSGAIMADFVADLPGANAQWNEGPQLDEIAPAGQPSDSTGLVTLSVGGNDVGFPFVMKACVDGLGNSSTDRSCQAEIKTELGLGTKLLTQGGTILLDTKNNSYVFCDEACVAQYSPQSTKNKNSDLKVVTVPSLAGLYALVHQRAPQAEIRVLQYPHLFPAKPATSCTVASLFNQKYVVDQTEMKAINSAGDTLDGIIASAVATASSQGIDIQAVDSRSDFAGHEVCSSAPWINALELSNQVYSFHPNSIGQQQFAGLFEAQL
jgi:lysophospholipase L1-like esterase